MYNFKNIENGETGGRLAHCIQCNSVLFMNKVFYWRRRKFWLETIKEICWKCSRFQGNILSKNTCTMAGPWPPKNAIFLLVDGCSGSDAPPKKGIFLRVPGSTGSRISLRCPLIVLFNSGPDSWNCLRPKISKTTWKEKF